MKQSACTLTLELKHNLTEGNSYKWSLAKASGEGQATMGDVLASGTAMLTSLVANAAVNQNITYNGSFTGVGVLDTASSDSDSDEENNEGSGT